jgi:branched-chain amino acid transport system ATP-binding protein
VTAVPAERRVAMGMGHVPQGRQVFPHLTVEENLRLGAYTLRRRARSRYAAALDGVYDRFPVLRERRNQSAGTLSGGQQASLSVARALVNEPTLVLVDEPSAGLSPKMQLDLREVLQVVKDSGVTMVLVEQNVAFGLSLVDTANLLQTARAHPSCWSWDWPTRRPPGSGRCRSSHGTTACSASTTAGRARPDWSRGRRTRWRR